MNIMTKRENCDDSIVYELEGWGLRGMRIKMAESNLLNNNDEEREGMRFRIKRNMNELML